jgi:hypothetical protein
MRAILLTIVLGAALAMVTPAAAAPATCTLTVVHGLPGFTADVYMNGKLVLDGFKPEQSTQPLSLPAGTYQVAIRSVGSPSTSKPALEGRITLAAGQNFSAVAHLTGADRGQLSLFRNEMKSVAPGRGRLIVRNVASVPALSVAASGRTIATGLGEGHQAEMVLPAQRYTLSIKSSGTSLLPDRPVTVPEGHDVIVYVIGSATSNSLDLMVQDVKGVGTDPSGIPSGDAGLAAPGRGRAADSAVAVFALLAAALAAMKARRAFQARSAASMPNP